MSSSFEAKDYQIPSRSKPSIDDHNLSSNDQTSLKSPPQHQRPTEGYPLKDHRLPKNHNQPPPPSQQHLPTRTLPSKDHNLLKNLNQYPPPSLQPSQQRPARTLYSNVEQPKKDSHAKLTNAEPVTGPSNIQKPDKQPITLAKLTSAEPVTHYPKNYLSQSDEAPPSQPVLPLPPPPPPPPKPPARTLSWNVEQPTNYKQSTNLVTSAEPEPEPDYPEHYLSQSDGPPSPQQYPLAPTLSPKDQFKNLKLPPAGTLASNVDQPAIYKQVSDNENLTQADPVTAYPENYYSQPNGPPPYQPPPPPPPAPSKSLCPFCSIL